ncbi:scarecrow-like protein 3 [Aegilops tauschii subsp. strangulata]|uniref:scarecrow-like protein 3 n=1 Tax=Aegilops tauschii subsp. strangulata TaxID=200361 RepID=UPI003CC88C90
MMRADALLRDLAELSPKLMVVTALEADDNALERSDVERCLLLHEIRDIVSCDGAQRRERHEQMVKWAERMMGAGFVPQTQWCKW